MLNDHSVNRQIDHANDYEKRGKKIVWIVCINIELIDLFLIPARGEKTLWKPKITSQYAELDAKEMTEIKITAISMVLSFLSLTKSNLKGDIWLMELIFKYEQIKTFSSSMSHTTTHHN